MRTPRPRTRFLRLGPRTLGAGPMAAAEVVAAAAATTPGLLQAAAVGDMEEVAAWPRGPTPPPTPSSPCSHLPRTAAAEAMLRHSSRGQHHTALPRSPPTATWGDPQAGVLVATADPSTEATSLPFVS